jgi:hypothetical protein
MFRGHIIPVDPTAASSPTLTYDLGSDAHRWRYVWGKCWPDVKSTTGSATLGQSTHEIVLFNTTAATLTATLPAASGNTGASFIIKNIGTGSNTLLIDGNASETIDNTLTVNIVDYESVKLICNGSGWFII